MCVWGKGYLVIEYTINFTNLIPLAVEEQLPWLEEYLLAVSGARVDVLLYDAPISQFDSDTMIKQANYIKLGL